MVVLNSVNLFETSLFLYILSALLSLVFARKPKLCTTISQITCMLAAAAGLASALLHLFVDHVKIAIDVFSSTIPLLSFNFTIDNLSALFILSLSILTICVSLYSLGYLSHYFGKRNMGLFNFLYSTFILSMLLVFTSGNAVFFLFAWEAMSAISYFLVVFESEKEESQQAGTLYLIMTGIGTAFLLVAFLLMYHYTGTFDLFVSSSCIPAAIKNLMFVFFLIGFGTKAGIIPLHVWLPAAHPAAPGNVSALMSGIMLKTAVYGLIRFTLGYLGVSRTWWGMALLAVGMVSAVLGVAYAFVENDIKKLLAYSSIENMGIIFIGLGVGFIALTQGSPLVGSIAIAAALFHAFNHTLMKGCLFLGAGSIHWSTHTRNMEELGGLIRVLPVTAVFMLFASLAISAIVPFNGFASEWLTLQSIFASIVPGQGGTNVALILSVAALALSGGLAAACFVKLLGISFLGKPRSVKAEHAARIPAVMNYSMGLLSVLCLLFGLFPALFLRIADRVMLDLTKTSLSGQINGWFTLQSDPLENAGGTITPLAMLAVLGLLILLTMFVLRMIGGKVIKRKYGTWDCGYEALNARMQYSSTGFSKSIKIVFRILFRPTRETKFSGDLPYHPETIEYTVLSESIIEKYLYDPVTKFIKRLSKKTKFSIQTGSIHRYLAYIFFALVALMLYNIIA